MVCRDAADLAAAALLWPEVSPALFFVGLEVSTEVGDLTLKLCGLSKMPTYLAAESAFLRSLSNRFLLLFFLAALTRMGGDVVKGNAAVMGISLQISQGWLIVAGSVICLLFALLMENEAESLTVSRYSVLEDFSQRRYLRKQSWLPRVLFFSPAAFSLFFTVQFISNLIPADMSCADYKRLNMLIDFTHVSGSPSIFCIGDVTENMPWIYAPIQTYVYLALFVWCVYIGIQTTGTWLKFRGADGLTSANSQG